MPLKVLTPNLMVEDVDAAVAYYRDVLGFALVQSVPEVSPFLWAMVSSGAVALMFEARTSLSQNLPAFAAAPIGATFTLYIDTDDADALYIRVKDRAQVVIAPNTAPYGRREFALIDPHGYVLVFSSAS